MNYQRLVGNILVVLNALLLFVLLFGARMQFPPLLQTFGRAHPILLHLPIGTIIIIAILLLVKKQFKKGAFRKSITGLLALAGITSAIVALMGIVLSAEGGYNEDTLALHKYSGAILSFVVAAAYFIFTSEASTINAFKIITIASLPVMIFAGHYGSILTHGDDFIFEPLLSKEENVRAISDSTSLYAAAIQPIFDSKCTGCHNEKKLKGDLVLSTLAGIASGGEHGEVWLPGNPRSSLLMKLVLLPESNDDHMPPSGKAQLTSSEVQLLFQWILSGADTAKAWTKYAAADTVRKLAEQFIHTPGRNADHVQYTFEPASSSTIEKLNDPYRVVAPIAVNEPALSATFFIRNEYKPSRLKELSAVKEQLVSLNLSKMPVDDADCEIIRQFTNLEKLNLNFSSITSRGLQTLSSLPGLKSLSIAGTSLDAGSLAALKDFRSLKEIFIWNTPAATDIASLQKDLPSLAWNSGFVPPESERLRLTPPIPNSDKTLIDDGEKIMLTHKLPGTVIRYTTDGSDPDSSTAKVFDTPFTIDGFTIVKTRACKDGWFCSPVGTYILYSKGIAPIDTKLLTVANKDYKGEGASTFSNNKKGFTDDHRDIAWIGFRDNPMSAEFNFPAGTNVKEITVCYDRNTGGWLFPPVKLEIWAGKDPEHLALIKQVKPEQPLKMESTRNDALVIPVEGEGFETYKIMAWPLAELPKWHPSNNPKTKDKRAWFFVDEVIFR